MALKTGPDSELAGSDGMVIIDLKAGTLEPRPAFEKQVNADNARIADQTRDAVGRRIITIGGQEFTDDGENLALANRMKSTAYPRTKIDYGA